jgi:hypothetical protein
MRTGGGWAKQARALIVWSPRPVAFSERRWSIFVKPSPVIFPCLFALIRVSGIGAILGGRHDLLKRLSLMSDDDNRLSARLRNPLQVLDAR